MMNLNRLNITISALSVILLLGIIFFAPTDCQGGVGVLNCGAALRLWLSGLIYGNAIFQVLLSWWSLFLLPASERSKLFARHLSHLTLLILIFLIAWLWFQLV